MQPFFVSHDGDVEAEVWKERYSKPSDLPSVSGYGIESGRELSKNTPPSACDGDIHAFLCDYIPRPTNVHLSACLPLQTALIILRAPSS